MVSFYLIARSRWVDELCTVREKRWNEASPYPWYDCFHVQCTYRQVLLILAVLPWKRADFHAFFANVYALQCLSLVVAFIINYVALSCVGSFKLVTFPIEISTFCATGRVAQTIRRRKWRPSKLPWGEKPGNSRYAAGARTLIKQPLCMVNKLLLSFFEINAAIAIQFDSNILLYIQTLHGRPWFDNSYTI